MPDFESNKEMSKMKCQTSVPLLSAMKSYSGRDIAAFDVPGHKRGQGVAVLNDYFGEGLMKMDVNSLPELDNVANPSGVIKEAQDLLADLMGADAAFFMANGSTSSIHCMLMSVLSPGDKILIPKNIHKSALNGLILCGAHPVYLKPDICPREGLMKNVSPSDIECQLIANPDAKAVFVLNPTYYGHATDLRRVVEICNERGVLLLADEAHGTHLPFHDDLPPSAMECGADISCISVHKTGGALTQASALLVNSKRVNVNKVKQVINMLQSTSCSYLLMGSIDGARQNLAMNGREQLTKALDLSKRARRGIDSIPGVSVVSESGADAVFFDITKLGINVSGLSITGFKVYEILWKKYDIQLESSDFNHVLAIISLGDCEVWIDRLIDALKEISDEFYSEMECKKPVFHEVSAEFVVSMSPRDAYFSEKELVSFRDGIGRVSGESIMAYPPGIPVVSPGELITEEIIGTLEGLKSGNAFIVDNFDPDLEQILVIKE